MRNIYLSLSLQEQREYLYACALLAYNDKIANIVLPANEQGKALSYGANLGIIAEDYETTYATVFPTNGPPQRP